LLSENEKLRELLRTTDKFSPLTDEIEQKLKDQEKLMMDAENERKNNKQGEFADNFKENQALLGKKKANIPNTVRLKMMERMKQKAENDRMKEEIRRLAEEEIMRYMI
jgi:hypothetical protein